MPTFLNPLAELDMHVEHIPHWQQNDAVCFITWRLADSLPQVLLREWNEQRAAWLARNPEPWTAKQTTEYYTLFSQRIDTWLDQGMGSRLLAKSECATIVSDTMMYFDGERFLMHAYVIMPTHVHVLFSPLHGHRMEKIVQGWKSVSARRLVRECGVGMPVWQKRYWDRLIRNDRHFEACVGYIRDNPGKAGLRREECVVYVRGSD